MDINVTQSTAVAQQGGWRRALRSFTDRPTETPDDVSGWSHAELFAGDAGSGRKGHWLLASIIAFFVVGLLWAALAHLDEVARGEGKVITISQTQYVQNLEGGIIREILVHEGDAVEKGQLLFRIDPTRFVSEYRSEAQTTLALKARIARLAAEAEGRPLKFPAEVLKDAPALAQSESSLYHTHVSEQQNRNGILREQLAQRAQELREMKSRGERLTEGLDVLKREIALTAPLVKLGHASEVELLRLERERARIGTDLDAAKLALPRIEAYIIEAQKKLRDNDLTFRSAAGKDLADARGELAKRSESMPALEDRVARSEVRAPMKGIIKVIANKTVGGVVQPGSSLAEIVPLESSLLVEAHVKPADIAFVKVGQRAMVKVSAYDYSIYGGVEGTVEYLSGDSMQPEKGEPFFVARVRANTSGIKVGDKLLPITPGMTATVDIMTGRKTVLHYLLKPVNKARERALTER